MKFSSWKFAFAGSITLAFVGLGCARGDAPAQGRDSGYSPFEGADAGPPIRPMDAGNRDAGTDAGAPAQPDAGPSTMTEDGGPTEPPASDAGRPDAGPMVDPTCTDNSDCVSGSCVEDELFGNYCECFDPFLNTDCADGLVCSLTLVPPGYFCLPPTM